MVTKTHPDVYMERLLVKVQSIRLRRILRLHKKEGCVPGAKHRNDAYSVNIGTTHVP